MNVAVGNYIKVYDDVLTKEECEYILSEYKNSPGWRTGTISLSFSLNDDYAGGEFAFFNRETKIKTRPGSVILFPSNFMYPHEIMPVTKGTRYSIITWFN